MRVNVLMIVCVFFFSVSWTVSVEKGKPTFFLVSLSFLDEWMFECLLDIQALLGIKEKNLVQEISQLQHFLHLFFGQTLMADEQRQQISARIDIGDRGDLVLNGEEALPFVLTEHICFSLPVR